MTSKREPGAPPACRHVDTRRDIVSDGRWALICKACGAWWDGEAWAAVPGAPPDPPRTTTDELRAALERGAERANRTAEILRRVEAGGRVSIEDMRHVLGPHADAKVVAAPVAGSASFREARRLAHAEEPESQTVGQLNTSVRVLREEVYQQRLRAQAAEAREAEARSEIERLRHEAVERETLLSTVKTQRDAGEALLREWVEARLDLREWLHDKSTPRDDAETDRRFERAEAAEKAARAVLGARPGNDATKEE